MIVRTDKDRNEFIIKALSVDLTKKPWEFNAEPYKPNRSAAQRRLTYMWYAEIGKHTGNGKDYERNFCKWTYGCPILIANDNPKRNFTPFYEKLINTYTYEERIEAMAFVEVTSLFKVGENVEYLNHIDMYAQELGCKLTQPVSIYDEAMGQ